MSSASSQRSKGNLIYQNNRDSQGAALCGESSSSITLKVRKNNSNRKPTKKFKFDENEVIQLNYDGRQREDGN